MAHLKQIVIDSAAPSALAKFWAEALEGFEVRPYDHDEINRLAALGQTPDTDPCVLVDGPDLEICFQLSDPEGPSKRSLHLDLESADRPSEVDRLVKLGATVRYAYPDHTWMVDPEGNDFCLTDPD